MRLISSLIGFAILAFLLLPYYNVYQISSSVQSSDLVTLAKMVDLEAVRKVQKTTLEQQAKNAANTLGMQNSQVTNTLQGGWASLGNLAIEQVVDINWVRAQLQPTGNQTLWNAMSYAFFESPTRFTVRLGELGNNPVFVELTLHDWSWRVSAIYR